MTGRVPDGALRIPMGSLSLITDTRDCGRCAANKSFPVSTSCTKRARTGSGGFA
jgi:hypothetical protein